MEIEQCDTQPRNWWALLVDHWAFFFVLAAGRPLSSIDQDKTRLVEERVRSAASGYGCQYLTELNLYGIYLGPSTIPDLDCYLITQAQLVFKWHNFRLSEK